MKLIDENFFDFELLNLRKQNFDYGETEAENKSPQIMLHHLKTFNLKMSGEK